MFKLNLKPVTILFSGVLILSYQTGFAENPMEKMIEMSTEVMKSAKDTAEKAMGSAVEKATQDAGAAKAKLPSFNMDFLTQSGEPPEPSVDFKWTQETVKLATEGDVKRGEELAKQGKCSKCHGDTGVPEDDDYTPSIAGQITAYSFKQLHDYKVRLRDSKEMRRAVRKLSSKDMADVSAYYATQKPEKKMGVKIPVLANIGDKKRYLLACNYCHNDDSMNRGYQTPILEGQKIEYFKETMLAFKEGERVNDHYSLMRGLSSKLTEAEIDELAEYYSAKPSE